VSRPDYTPVLKESGVLPLPTSFICPYPNPLLRVFTSPSVLSRGRILHCTVVYPLELYPAFFGYYFFNSMMGVLQLLHIFWAYLILRMAHKFITGKVNDP